MKKNLLIALLSCSVFISCDERKTVETLTPAVISVSKTDVIARKWFVTETSYTVDGKKTIISGVGAATNLTATIYSSPNNYYNFSKDGKLQVYTENKSGVAKTADGTWKFLSNETQAQLLYGAFDYKFNILSLTDKTMDVITPKILMANLATETDTNKNIILGGGLTGLIDDKSKEVQFGIKFGVK